MFCAHIPKLDSSASCFIQSRTLASIPVGAGNDTRDHALTGDGKLLLFPNSQDNSVSALPERIETRQNYSESGSCNAHC